MEIVLAILLFFGGLTVGSMHSAENGVAMQADTTGSEAMDVSSGLPAKQASPRIDPTPCNDHEGVYRDLTVSLPDNAIRCKGECPDE